MAYRAPFDANFLATAPPIPCAPPVTIALLLSKPMWFMPPVLYIKYYLLEPINLTLSLVQLEVIYAGRIDPTRSSGLGVFIFIYENPLTQTANGRRCSTSGRYGAAPSGNSGIITAS